MRTIYNCNCDVCGENGYDSISAVLVKNHEGGQDIKVIVCEYCPKCGSPLKRGDDYG